MAVEERDKLTPEEIYNSVEWKAIDRAIRQEFPWVKKIIIKPDELNRWNIVFVEFVVDPFLMKNYIGLDPQSWVLRQIKSKNQYDDYHMYLSTVLDGATYEEDKEIKDTANKIMREIHNSIIIPKHLKLPESRLPQMGGYIIPANTEIPPEYKLDSEELWNRLMNIRQTN